MINGRYGVAVATSQHVQRVIDAGAALTIKDLAINGKDLMRELGLRSTLYIGESLRFQLLDGLFEGEGGNVDRGGLRGGGHGHPLIRR